MNYDSPGDDQGVSKKYSLFSSGRSLFFQHFQQLELKEDKLHLYSLILNMGVYF